MANSCCSTDMRVAPQGARTRGGMITDWNDIIKMTPKDILDVIAYAELGGTEGTFIYSSTYADSAWSTNPFAIASAPYVDTVHTDNQFKVEEAKQWNMQHLTWNNSAAVPPPSRNSGSHKRPLESEAFYVQVSSTVIAGQSSKRTAGITGKIAADGRWYLLK